MHACTMNTEAILTSYVKQALFYFRIKSRWMPTVFEILSPQLQGTALTKAQKNLKKKRMTAHKSIAVLISYLHNMISNYEDDEECISCQEDLQKEISLKKYTLDQRAIHLHR